MKLLWSFIHMNLETIWQEIYSKGFCLVTVHHLCGLIVFGFWFSLFFVHVTARQLLYTFWFSGPYQTTVILAGPLACANAALKSYLPLNSLRPRWIWFMDYDILEIFGYISVVISERGNFNVVWYILYTLNNKTLGLMWSVICESVGLLCGV